jgi:hypothetical protein
VVVLWGTWFGEGRKLVLVSDMMTLILCSRDATVTQSHDQCHTHVCFTGPGRRVAPAGHDRMQFDLWGAKWQGFPHTGYYPADNVHEGMNGVRGRGKTRLLL